MPGEKFKVHIITQEEPFLVPKFIRFLLDHQKDYSVESYTVLSPSRKNSTIVEWIEERLKVYNIVELFLATSLFVVCKFLNILRISTARHSVKRVLRDSSGSEIITQDINSPDYISELYDIYPDIILSISCPQLFKEELIQVPRKYCLNAHGTLLPKHRGVFGSWWTLYSGDDKGGGTLHTIELRLDAGKILWQDSFSLKDTDTQFSVAYKTKKMMAEGFVQLMKDISNGAESKISSKFEESYHRAPTRREAKEFHKKGNRIVTLKDVHMIFSGKF